MRIAGTTLVTRPLQDTQLLDKWYEGGPGGTPGPEVWVRAPKEETFWQSCQGAEEPVRRKRVSLEEGDSCTQWHLVWLAEKGSRVGDQ